MLNRIARLPNKALSTAKVFASQQAIVMNWAIQGIIAVNWGDKLNPYFGKLLSKREVVHRNDVIPYIGMPIYFAVGSNLGTATRHAGSVVWGSGFVSSNTPIEGRPDRLHAVRGWLSAERLHKHGIEPPEVVGDPALLLPLFYRPRPPQRRYELGVIPHCLEQYEPFALEARRWPDTTVIDITGEIDTVIDQIAACDRIVSTSLHGIICADAYGVPAIWLHSSDKVGTDGFKFRDYFSSVERKDLEPIKVNSQTRRNDLLNAFKDYKVTFDSQRLLDACPFWDRTPPPLAKSRN